MTKQKSKNRYWYVLIVILCYFLSRTALSLAQLCPGQRSASLCSVPDSAQPDSAPSRTALSLTHLCPGQRSAWLISVPDGPQLGSFLSLVNGKNGLSAVLDSADERKRDNLLYFCKFTKVFKSFCYLTKPENLVKMFFNSFVTRKNLLSRIFAKNFRSDDP